MVDAPVGVESQAAQSFVGVQEVGQAGVGECYVVGAHRHRRGLGKSGNAGDGYAVVFPVEAQKGQTVITVDQVGLEHGQVPLDHLLVAVGSAADHVCQVCRSYALGHDRSQLPPKNTRRAFP